MRQNADVIAATPVLDTSIYAAGDVLWTTPVTLTNIARVKGGVIKLKSLVVIDASDQAPAIDLYFMNVANSLGTFNVAPNISDANALAIVGRVQVAAADYLDLGGVRVARVALSAVEQIMKALSTDRNLYLAGVLNAGTPTFAASDLQFLIGAEQYPFGFAG